ncbi:mitochondrial ornithine transporter 1-like [Clytia hemisphaerica]|uniref:mitochondrial ornithine transporter 1-like n=1 Tax=Clytia hemisphaerica TaxID=252671 RepID=UPI0034D515DD
MASETQSIRKEAIIDFTAGAIGGTCCAYVGQPLDTIKVKMQTYPDLYRSSWRCAADIVKKQGFMRFYAGAVPAAAANIAETSVLFLCYGQCRKVVAWCSGTPLENMGTVHNALSGSFAAFFAAFSLCPLELIKCRMQTLMENQGTFKNITPFTIIKDVLRTDGFFGFYRGITSTVLREVPGYFFFFGGYEGTKYLLSQGNEDQELGLGKTIIAGGVGGVSIWAAIYPFDIIKSRMQVYSSGGGAGISLMETSRLLMKEGGVRAFYSGVGPTLCRAFPACAALFVGYEYSKSFLTKVTS